MTESGQFVTLHHAVMISVSTPLVMFSLGAGEISMTDLEMGHDGTIRNKHRKQYYMVMKICGEMPFTGNIECVTTVDIL